MDAEGDHHIVLLGAPLVLTGPYADACLIQRKVALAGDAEMAWSVTGSFASLGAFK